MKKKNKVGKHISLSILIAGTLLFAMGFAWKQDSVQDMRIVFTTQVSKGSACKQVTKIIREIIDAERNELEHKVEEIASLPVEQPVQIADQVLMNSVREINLNEYQIEDLTLLITQLMQFYQLEKVEMCNTNLSDEQMAALGEMFPDTKFVWVVHCGSFSVRTDALAFSTMYMGYGWDPMTEADFEPLKYCTDLEALDIGHHSMRDISFLKDLKKLKILIIAINKFQDITPLTEMTDLTYLELFLNDIRDLTPLASLTNLEHLNLCHNKNLGNIEPILHFPRLQRLWISYCNLTQEEIQQIKEAYPNTQLEFNVYESVEAGWRSTEVYTRMRNVFNTSTMDEMFLPKS